MRHRYGSLTRAARALFVRTAKRKRGRQYPVQQVKKVTLRTTFTHIAVICDDAALQPLLPQVIVANTRTVLRKQLLRLILESLPNVRLVRRQTSWNTAALQEEIIGWLREVVEPFRDCYTPVLLMDVALVRLSPPQRF